jgi:UDP-N-acetylmuramoyl-tripeptide--D-alanyl-D-alanine ligase
MGLTLLYAKQPQLALLATIGGIQIIPLALNTANTLLWPLQHYQGRRYLQEATATLQRLNPTVVSISGAFGKTSTKYLLGQILSAHGPTLISPGSTNTPLGLAQIINAQLQPHHQYFLAEMGAYKIGSIANICTLYPPHACATTAIGAAHYERFKSLAAIAQAEFEVIDATLAHGGPAVLSIDCIPTNLWQPRVQAAPHIKLVGSDQRHIRKGDYWIKSSAQTAAGLTVQVVHQGKSTTLKCPLYGTTMAPNMATAFALATELGVPKTVSAAALASAQGAPHRLQRREEPGMTILDDSYNSNPAGFAAALEVLTLIGGAKPSKKARRKILITPGMVELGTLHAPEHARLGTLAAQHADVVMAVAPQRIPTFTAAVKAAGHTELVLLPTLSAAFAWLRTNGQADDIVLLENDLPDRYEAKWKL